MSPQTVGLICGLFLALVAVSAWYVVGLFLDGARWVLARLDPAANSGAEKGAQGRSPDTCSSDTGRGRCQAPQGRPPKGVDNGRAGVHFLGLPLAVAMQPDFDSFFGGFQAAIDSGGIVLIAIGIVLIARRYTSNI